jgi:aromatic ring hydroxylase
MVWGLSDAMAKTADPREGGEILPGMEPAAAYQVLAPEAYAQIRNLIEKTVASGLIYLNSHAHDFKNPNPISTSTCAAPAASTQSNA